MAGKFKLFQPVIWLVDIEGINIDPASCRERINR
jgi:hypothetical protein